MENSDQAKTYRLPKEFAIKWVAALRSGEYKQGDYCLMKKNYDGEMEYCCLGVAGKIAGCIMREVEDVHLDDSGESRVLNLDVIPKELIGNGMNRLIYVLTDLNDAKGFTFHQIADWIEENVEFY